MKRLILFVALPLFGLMVGAAVASYFIGSFHNYGNDARLIADATMDVTALEKLAANDTAGARSILETRLRISFAGLETSGAQLSEEQAKQVAELERRASAVLPTGR